MSSLDKTKLFQAHVSGLRQYLSYVGEREITLFKMLSLLLAMWSYTKVFLYTYFICIQYGKEQVKLHRTSALKWS